MLSVKILWLDRSLVYWRWKLGGWWAGAVAPGHQRNRFESSYKYSPTPTSNMFLTKKIWSWRLHTKKHDKLKRRIIFHASFMDGTRLVEKYQKYCMRPCAIGRKENTLSYCSPHLGVRQSCRHLIEGTLQAMHWMQSEPLGKKIMIRTPPYSHLLHSAQIYCTSPHTLSLLLTS